MTFHDFLTSFQHQSRAKSNEQLVEQRVTAAIVDILQTHRLLGEVLLQIPREFKSTEQAIVTLGWHENDLRLLFNPAALTSARSDELRAFLEHEALHIVWLHPYRYATYLHPDLAQLATDMAVNQYLATPPRGTATLSQVQRVLRRKIAPGRDSKDYLDLLEKLPVDQQEKLRQAGLRLNGHRRGEAENDALQRLKSHHSWQSIDQQQGKVGNQIIRLAKLKRILQQAWSRTPQRDRGLLPGGIEAPLGTVQSARIVDWRRVLRQQIGLLAHGQQDSPARFNRRQPLRMDLPGKITRLVPAIDIFVDNSGSVSDQELGQALATIKKMLQKTHLSAMIYSFDAQVTARTRFKGRNSLPAVRHGGGGTKFQCIFDYLRQHHVAQNGQLTIIITDGWGEEQVDFYRYHNVCWLLLTTVDQLSVKNPPGQVLVIKEGD